VTTLVDTNVIVDVLTRDAKWLDWSLSQLVMCAAAGALCVNEVSYAELAVRFQREADLAYELGQLGTEMTRAPTSALFLAGRAFSRYRTLGGPRTSLLPDFFVGGHARAMNWPILTRDPRRFRAYFPDVPLIAPDA